MKKRRFGKRLLTGTLCIGMVTSMLTTTAMAAPYDDLTIAGVAAAVHQNEANQENHLVAPLASASILASAALEVQAEAVTAGVSAEAVSAALPVEEHPAVVATEARMQEEAESPYKDIAISQVENYVNIRTEPNVEAEVVGKIYNNSSAQILDTVEMEDGEWYKILSGSVEGYIKAEFFVTGEDAEAIAREVGYVTATINTETLRLRADADLGSSTLSLLSQGENYEVVSQEGDFTQILVDNDLYGYVSNDYIDEKVEFAEAISIEEERAKQEEEARKQREAEEAAERLRQEQEAAARAEEAAAENSRSDSGSSSSSSSSSSNSGSSSSSNDSQDSSDRSDNSSNDNTADDSYDNSDSSGNSGSDSSSDDSSNSSSDDSYNNSDSSDNSSDSSSDDSSSDSSDSSDDSSNSSSDDSYDDSSDDSGSGSESSSSLRDAIVSYAESFAGNLAYVWGGTSLTTGADCSGFVQAIFRTYGISLPRTSDEQGYSGTAVSSSDMRPGDIVYYGGHIAIYIGDGLVVHASSAKTGVKISSWNYRTVLGIRNVIGD